MLVTIVGLLSGGTITTVLGFAVHWFRQPAQTEGESG